MLELRDQDVLHVARLARLKLEDSELDQVRRDLNRVLDYVSKLHELSLEQVQPTMHVVETQAPLRPDETKSSLTVGQAIQNAPAVRDAMFQVPRIIDGGEAGE